MANRRRLFANLSWRRPATFSSAIVALSLGVLSACNGGNPGGSAGDMGADGGDTGNADMTGGPPVTVTVTRTGSGVVSSSPAGIDCGGAGGCSAMFPSGVPIELTAVGQGGTAFAGWSGACAGQPAVCTVIPTADVTVGATFSPLTCTSDNLCWEAPLPFGMDLRDVTATAANDVWAVGTQGSILHYDGSRWNFSNSGTQNDLQSVSASAANNAWVAGGSNGLVLRWDGTSWSSVNTGRNVFTSGIYTSGPSSVIATELGSNALHYNGTNWTARVAVARNGVGILRGISGSSATNVWVYGDDLSVSTWNGTAWTFLARTYVPTGIYASPAGGGYMQHFTSQMYKVATTGYTMPTAPTADVSGTSGIVGLWGIDGNNVFTSGPQGVLYKFNGTTWSTIQTPVKEVGVFAKGAGSSPNDMWLVGRAGIVARWDGTKVTSDRANVLSGDITNVWGSGPNDVWFVTDKRTVIHYDGTSYRESQPLVSGTNANLYGIGGSGPKDVWLCAGENNVAVMLHYDGTSWKKSTLPTLLTMVETSMNVVWASSPNNAWAWGGSITTGIKWDGNTWQLDNTSAMTQLAETLWGSGPNDVFVAGGGDMLRYNGTSWSRTGMLTAMIRSIGGSGPTDVWAGGDLGAYRWNGSAWGTVITVPGKSGSISRITSTSGNDAWASDSQGGLYRWNGAMFRQINTSLGRPGQPMSIWASNAGVIWFGGHGILTYGR